MLSVVSCGKIMCLLIRFIAVFVTATSPTVIAQSQGSFSFPENCDRDSCMYTASWMSIPGGFADFTVSAKVEISKWAGIGFSNNGRMIGSDAVVGWVTKDEIPILQDRFLIAKSADQVPVDEMQNIAIKAISQDNKMLKYSFSRPLMSPDSERDLNLTSCVFLLFASGGDGNADGSITKHTFKMATQEKVCFDNIPIPPLLPIMPTTSIETTEATSTAPPTTMTETVLVTTISTEAEKEIPVVESGVSKDDKTTMKYPEFSKAEQSCDIKVCPKNSHCVMEHGLARCYCLPQYPMDKYGNCRGKSIKPVKHDKCTDIKCPDHAMCHDGHCLCKPGYSMKDNTCKAKFIKPHVVDRCKNVKCSEREICQNGFCTCKAGYKFTHEGCKMSSEQKKDKCENMKCSKNAKCELGYCRCMTGYKLDHGTCKKPGSMRDERKCGHGYCSENAECYFGRLCKCKRGYNKTPHNVCVPSSSLCNGKKCYHNAHCNHMGKCQCNSGYVEHHGYCKPVAGDPCKNMNCGPYRSCVVLNQGVMCIYSSPKYPKYSCMGKCGKYNYNGRCSCNITCLKRGGCCHDFTKYCTRMPGHHFHGRG